MLPDVSGVRALSESDVAAAQAYAGDVGISGVTQALSSLVGTGVVAVPGPDHRDHHHGLDRLTLALYITGPFKLAFPTYSGKAKMGRGPGAYLGISIGLRHPAVPRTCAPVRSFDALGAAEPVGQASVTQFGTI